MNRTGHPFPTLVFAVLAAILLALLAATAFAGWIDHGSAILLSMAETGMAWCF